jgi:hypothetical protein
LSQRADTPPVEQKKTLAGRGQFTALIELSFQLINHPRAG